MQALSPGRRALLHRYANTGAIGEGLRLLIASIGVPGNSDAWIVRENTFNALRHQLSAVGDSHLSGVLRVSDAHPAAIVNGDPACATGSVQQGVKESPVCNGITAIPHGFGFPKWGCNRTTVKVIAANDDRSFDCAALHQIVHRQPELSALSMSQPADTRRQALEADPFTRQVDPAAEDSIFGKHL